MIDISKIRHLKTFRNVLEEVYSPLTPPYTDEDLILAPHIYAEAHVRPAHVAFWIYVIREALTTNPEQTERLLSPKLSKDGITCIQDRLDELLKVEQISHNTTTVLYELFVQREMQRRILEDIPNDPTLNETRNFFYSIEEFTVGNPADGFAFIQALNLNDAAMHIQQTAIHMLKRNISDFALPSA